MRKTSKTTKSTKNLRETTTEPEGSSMTRIKNSRTAKKRACMKLKEVIVAKKATAWVGDCVYVSHPAETAMVYINDNFDGDGEGYVGWLDTVYDKNKAQEYRGALELANGEFFMHAGDTDDLAVKLMHQARRLGFRFALVYELIDNPVRSSITEL